MSDEIILIPAFNEYKSLKYLLKKISFKVLIINDASTDKTKKLSSRSNVEIVTNPKNLGYEKSLIKGFKFIKKKYPKTKSVITFDADGEHYPSDLSRLIRFQKKVNADLVICNRKELNRFLEKILNYLFLIKVKIRDPLSGFKLYKFKSLKKNLDFIKTDQYLTEIINIYKIKNYKIENFPIECKKLKNRDRRVGNFTPNYKIFKSILKNLI